MDKTIDEIFFQLLNANDLENAKDEALGLVELHKVVRKDSAQKKDAGRDSSNLLEGVFTKHEVVFTPIKKTIWTIQPFIKEKKGTYKAVPLQGTAFGHVVDLDLWNCSCQEFAKSKYTSKSFNDDISSQLSNSELLKHCKSGWGGAEHFGTTPMNFRVPACVHIVAVFVFSRGRRLFSWIDRNNGGTELADDATNLYVDGFTTKNIDSVEDWIVLNSF